jgi:hypothetical protein
MRVEYPKAQWLVKNNIPLFFLRLGIHHPRERTFLLPQIGFYPAGIDTLAPNTDEKKVEVRGSSWNEKPE